MKRHLKILYALVFLLPVTGCLAPVIPEPDPEPEQIAYRVNASEMFDLFEQNEVAWAEKYASQLCAVSGYAWNIKADDDEIRVTLLDERDPFWIGERRIACHFDLSHTHAVAQLHEDQWITVVGRCFPSGGFYGMAMTGCYIEAAASI